MENQVGNHYLSLRYFLLNLLQVGSCVFKQILCITLLFFLLFLWEDHLNFYSRVFSPPWLFWNRNDQIAFIPLLIQHFLGAGILYIPSTNSKPMLREKKQKRMKIDKFKVGMENWIMQKIVSEEYMDKVNNVERKHSTILETAYTVHKPTADSGNTEDLDKRPQIL